MNTYSQLIYQIVFRTKNRERSLHEKNRDELFQYISGILKNKQCHLYRVNGVEDHIHILTHINPSISVSSLVKDIKMASSIYIKEKRLFPQFNGWQNGFGAFTYSFNEKDKLIEYVKNQVEHHEKQTFREEFVDLLNLHGISYDEKYLP